MIFTIIHMLMISKSQSLHWHLPGALDSYITKSPVDISTWIPHNHLALKMSKTKLIIFLLESVFRCLSWVGETKIHSLLRPKTWESPLTLSFNQSPSLATFNSPSHSPPLYQPYLSLVESLVISSVNYYNNFLPSFPVSGLASSNLTPSNPTLYTATN